MSRLIAVSAPVGGGKTSLVRALARQLPDADVIHFDSYEELSERPLEEMRRWLRRGGDIDELEVEALPEAIVGLRRGDSVLEPGTGRRIRPAPYIVFETPFGRLHRATGEAIDFAIWIDTPLDVALARNLLELGRRHGDDADFVSWLRGYLESYLDGVRDMLEMQRQRVAPDADLVLDGARDLETNVRLARDAILSRCP